MLHYGRKTRPSGQLLAKALEDYDIDINWGIGRSKAALNKPEAIKRAVNKRVALETMQSAGIPIPELSYSWPKGWFKPKVVGRPDYHSKGRYMYFKPLKRYKRRPTHFLRWLEADKEFRVHVIGGQVIKLSEKNPVGNIKPGESFFSYPYDFAHKKTLRKLACQAVEALGLDFGAADILYKEPNFYVLEVNTAPCLTSASNTLDKYIEAFKAKGIASRKQPPVPGLVGLPLHKASLQGHIIGYHPDYVSDIAHFSKWLDKWSIN